MSGSTTPPKSHAEIDPLDETMHWTEQSKPLPAPPLGSETLFTVELEILEAEGW